MRVIALLALLLASPTLAQQRIDRPGPVPHEQARTAFPERIGAFRRANVVSFGPAGDNISASYNLTRDGGRLLITIYIYPADRLAGAPEADGTREGRCQAEFQGANQAIEQAYPSARQLASGAVAPPAGVAPSLAHRSVYRIQTNFDERMQDIRSEARLYCYVGGGWLVKYRISSSEGMSVEDDIETFVALGPWPGRAAAAPGTIAP